MSTCLHYLHRHHSISIRIRPPRPSMTNTIARCVFSHSCHLHVVLVIVIIAIIMIITISISISISIFFCIFIVIFITLIIFKFILIFIVIFIIISIIIVLIMIILILILVLIILIIMAIVAGSTSLHLQQASGFWTAAEPGAHDDGMLHSKPFTSFHLRANPRTLKFRV